MKQFCLIIVLTIALSGCATVARGSNADFTVDTLPPGARVTTDLPAKGDHLAGRGCEPTPCSFEVSRKADFLLTISKDGYEPVEIGVVSRKHQESLNANFAGASATGLAIGGGFGTAILTSGIGSTFFTTGEAILAGAAVGGIVTGGVGVVSLGVDAASGALLNPNPNPVFMELPIAGTEVEEHPTVERLRIWRMEGEEGRAARKAYKKQEKAARKATKRAAKQAAKAARQAAKEAS